MSAKDTRVALAKAFREVTLSLIGLFDLYDADPDMAEAVAEALGRVFRAHLERSTPPGGAPGPGDALHGLADEMEAAAGEAA